MTAAAAPVNYLNAEHGLRSWLVTTDHKRIGILFLISITFFFLIGAAAAALIRLELVTPAGDLVGDDTYNRLFSLHGIVMVWFFLVPAVPATLGNFLLPLMIGAKDLAFPRLNLLSWYIYVLGALFTVATVILGGVDTGWTFYTPLSSLYAQGAVVTAVCGVFVVGFSSILSGINFMVTVHTLRAPGLTWFRLPLFVWSLYATSFIMVLATPVLSVTLLLVAAERVLGIGIFNPALGGDPLLFQHLFWFYSHPAVYIMILPGMGIVSEIIACSSRRRVFGYHFMAFSILAIAVLGFLVWGHHMFVSGQSTFATLFFGLLSFLVAVPSAIKVFNWVATMYRGRIYLDAPMLYALGFVGLFATGGVTGLFLASVTIDVHVHDTYFIVGHFHYIMVGGMVMAFFAGLHFWWPKITGRLYNAFLARFAAIVTFVGFNMTFLPHFVLGYLGMPRRYHSYPDEFQLLHVLSSGGAVVLGAGYLLPLIYLTVSLRWGARSGPNPWHAFGLEWLADSPPAVENFDRPPTVTASPYRYDPSRPQPLRASER